MADLRPVDGSEALLMLRNWVALQSGIDPARIALSAPLLKGDYLDSFALLSLTGVVEEMLGRTLSEAELQFDNFSSLQQIQNVFFLDGTQRHDA